jgi:hypothetical protein
MAVNAYKMAGAAGVGAMSSLVRAKIDIPLFDALIATALGALGYMAGMSLRGNMAAVGEGALDGAAAYFGAAYVGPILSGGVKTTGRAGQRVTPPLLPEQRPVFAPLSSVVEL